MRVLLVSWEYPPVIEGGLGRHVAHLSRGLAAAGHEVVVLTRGGGPGRGPAGSAAGRVRVIRVPVTPFGRDLDAFMGWVEALNDELTAAGAAELADWRPEVVHSHDWMVAPAARALARGYGSWTCPWVVTVHATEFGRHNGWVHTHPQGAIHWAERRMVRDADAVICCSSHMAGHVRRVFGRTGRLSAIPNGISEADLPAAPGTDLAALRRRYAPDGEALVLMVGRLVHEKGFHVALDALARLRAEGGVPVAAGGRAVRFLLAGAGVTEDALAARAARLGLREHGHFLGRVDDGRLNALYRIADVTVVPSLYEPFGIVPLEAMVSGCPVIVSDTGGLREVVADSAGAVRVPPGDPAALAGAIAAVLGDDAHRRAMGRAARRHADRFTWADVARATAEVYAMVGRDEPLADVTAHRLATDPVG